MAVALHRQCNEINELSNSLEESLHLTREEDSVIILLNDKQYNLTITGDYPSGGGILFCMSDDIDLPDVNAKLTSRCSLSKALILLGETLGIDLSWVQEAAGEDGDDDDEMRDKDSDDDMSSDEEDDGDELLREWSIRMTGWEKIERKVEAEEERDAANITNLDAITQRQIFDKRAAFRRLANEMEEIFKANDFNLMADAETDEGLYTWNISLAGFDQDSPIGKDLAVAGKRYGVSCIQLQLSFKRNLHPFYAPSLRLREPRLASPMLQSLAGYPLLTLDKWDPLMSATDVCKELKAFLEANARVEFDHLEHRSGMPAYLEIEQLMVRLQALKNVKTLVPMPALDNFTYPASTSNHITGDGHASKRPRSNGGAENQDAAGGSGDGGSHQSSEFNAEEEEPEVPKGQPQAWKQGVGYGTGKGQDVVWDRERSEAVQRARDKEAFDVLEALSREFTTCFNAEEGSYERNASETALRSGCLVPLIVSELSAISFQEMVDRLRYFNSLLKCVDAMAVPALADVLSIRPYNDARTVASTIEATRSQANAFSKAYRGASLNATTAMATGAGSGSSRPTSVAAAQQQQQQAAKASQEEQGEMELAKYLLTVADKVIAIAPKPDVNADAHGASGAHSENAAEGRYFAAMSQYRMQILPSGVGANHHYSPNASKETVPNKARAKKVARELASLETDGPVSTSSSVFVVADEANTVLWKAMITGPDDTPYSGGCFIFDIYFPPDYPNIAPKVLLRTTGGGTVRFNPNLYNEGKVCLSLLGTWQGQRGESWNANYSTILQVLVSIQSLILVPDPFYNEPGFEQRKSDSQSNAYSANIMEQTVRWAMIDMIKAPPPAFADAVKTHFRERTDAVLETVRGWVDWCRSKPGCGRHGDMIQRMLPELERELAKLR